MRLHRGRAALRDAAAPRAGGCLRAARPEPVLCPRAPVGATSSDILGHLHHQLRRQRPQELGMVVREMPLDRLEQLLIGAACKLRPAVAVGDLSLPLIDRGHFA